MSVPLTTGYLAVFQGTQNMTSTVTTRISPWVSMIFLIFLWVSLISLLASCAALPEHATQVKEIDDIAAVVEDALNLSSSLPSDELLVVFDIDNTLLAMTQGLGSDQWYEWQKELKATDPCNSQLVANRLAVQGALYFASSMRPTQLDVAEQIERLQKEGIRTIALTSRGPEFRLHTFRELRRAGISFYSSALPPPRGYQQPFIPKSGTRAARYEDGVFMTAGQHKGDMLAALLDKTGTAYPKIVVFADDKISNLNDVVNRFKGTGTFVHAWRYNREDSKVESFDPDAASSLWLKTEPSLKQLAEVFGTVHYDLPERQPAENCP